MSGNKHSPRRLMSSSTSKGTVLRRRGGKVEILQWQQYCSWGFRIIWGKNSRASRNQTQSPQPPKASWSMVTHTHSATQQRVWLFTPHLITHTHTEQNSTVTLRNRSIRGLDSPIHIPHYINSNSKNPLHLYWMLLLCSAFCVSPTWNSSWENAEQKGGGRWYLRKLQWTRHSGVWQQNN